jgi:hypothetical protein
MDKVLLNYYNTFDEKSLASIGAYPHHVNADASDESPWGRLSRSIFRGAVVLAAGQELLFLPKLFLEKKTFPWRRRSRGIIHSAVLGPAAETIFLYIKAWADYRGADGKLTGGRLESTAVWSCH